MGFIETISYIYIIFFNHTQPPLPSLSPSPALESFLLFNGICPSLHLLLPCQLNQYLIHQVPNWWKFHQNSRLKCSLFFEEPYPDIFLYVCKQVAEAEELWVSCQLGLQSDTSLQKIEENQKNLVRALNFSPTPISLTEKQIVCEGELTGQCWAETHP